MRECDARRHRLSWLAKPFHRAYMKKETELLACIVSTTPRVRATSITTLKKKKTSKKQESNTTVVLSPSFAPFPFHYTGRIWKNRAEKITYPRIINRARPQKRQSCVFVSSFLLVCVCVCVGAVCSVKRPPSEEMHASNNNKKKEHGRKRGDRHPTWCHSRNSSPVKAGKAIKEKISKSTHTHTHTLTEAGQ
jgi:hypothetical protein